MVSHFRLEINRSPCQTSSIWLPKTRSMIWPILSHKSLKRTLTTSAKTTSGSLLAARTQAHCQHGSGQSSLTSLLVLLPPALSFWLLRTSEILTNKFTFQHKKVAISVLKQFRKSTSMSKTKFWAITESTSSHNSRPKNWPPESFCFTGLMWLCFSSNTEDDKHSATHFKTRPSKRPLTSSRMPPRKYLLLNTEPTTWRTQSSPTKKAAAPDHGFTKAALSSVTSKPSQRPTPWDPRCSQLTFTGPGVRTFLDRELGHLSQELIMSSEGWVLWLITW